MKETSQCGSFKETKKLIKNCPETVKALFLLDKDFKSTSYYAKLKLIKKKKQKKDFSPNKTVNKKVET